MKILKLPKMKKKDYSKYFSDNYEEAREKFITQTKDKGMTQFSEKIVDGLTCDIAITETKNKNKLLILVSGTHGVEGYIGSAFQLMFLDRYFDKLNEKVSICFIHALNPYGFKYNRRVNENNVDINRNFCEDFNNMKINPKIFEIIKKNEEIFAANGPRKKRLYENYKLYTTMLKSVIKNGVVETIEAGVIGQNLYPKGINYSGVKEEKSNIVFAKIIKKITKEYDEAILLDLHTGIGRKYEMSGSTYHPKDSEEFKKCNKIVHTLSSHTGIHIYNIYSLGKSFLRLTNAKRNYEVLIEFGTISDISSILSSNYLTHLLVVENQIVFYGPKEKLEHIRKKMKKAYYPQETLYKMFMSRQVNKIGRRLLKIYN
jgi:hypothetical protein